MRHPAIRQTAVNTASMANGQPAHQGKYAKTVPAKHLQPVQALHAIQPIPTNTARMDSGHHAQLEKYARLDHALPLRLLI